MKKVIDRYKMSSECGNMVNDILCALVTYQERMTNILEKGTLEINELENESEYYKGHRDAAIRLIKVIENEFSPLTDE